MINPPYRAEQRYGKDMAKFGPTNEPLGLAYLAAMLEKHDHGVQIWDGMVQEPAEICYADIIGVTMLTPMYEQSRTMIRFIRGMYMNCKIVVGGPHPTALPSETLIETPEIDYLIAGEGEYHLLDYVEGKECPRSDNLDDLPMPARHLLPMNRYKMTASRSRHGHAFTIIVARGCPFNCGFCSRIHGKKVRFHSVDRVLQEVDVLVRDYGAKEINFEADTITLHKRFIYNLCNELVRQGFHKRIRWTCESRIDTVDPEMLAAMKRAGCWQISYGVETGTQRLLDLIQKGTRIDQIEQTFAFTKKAGVGIRAFYMLGLPTETKAETQATIDFAKKLDADWSQFTLFTPFPGTALWEIAAKEAPISQSWSDFRTHAGWTDHKPAWTPKGRSPDELKNCQKRAYRAVYLRPRTMARRLLKVRKFGEIATLWHGFVTVAKTAMPKSKLVRVDWQKLKDHSRGAYLSSTVYSDAAWPVRELNWRKLGAVASMVNGESGAALDLGCGNGVFLPTLSRMFDSVKGLDVRGWAARRLVRDMKLNNVEIIEGSAYRMPFGDHQFDAVFSTSAMEHMKDLYSAVNEIDRVLKPGGKLFFLSPCEGLFYRLGRFLLRYEKPKDHYWTANQISVGLKTYFREQDRRLYPFGLPVYQMGVYAKRY